MSDLVAVPPTGRQVPNTDLFAKVQSIPGVPFDLGQTATDVDITVAPEHFAALAAILQDDERFAFDFLRNIAGVDFSPEGMALKYAFYSFRYGWSLQVTVPTGVGHPVVPSLVDRYPTADWHEREAAEMFGFVFEGHPNLRNLLLEEDLHIHPLLKAHPLQAPEILQGIEAGHPGFELK